VSVAGPGLYRCPRCGQTLPLTAEHFYFRRDGRVNGYCRSGGCQRAYCAAYDRATAYRRQRDWYRRRHAVTPDRYRAASARVPQEAEA
jgi:hypothetical protein